MGQRPDEITPSDYSTRSRGADPVERHDAMHGAGTSDEILYATREPGASTEMPFGSSPGIGFGTTPGMGGVGGVDSPVGGPAYVDSYDVEDTGVESNVPDTDEELEASRAQIEQTRAEMSETIEALAQRLSPQNIAEQAKETVREATIGKAEDMVSNVSDSAKEAVTYAGDTARGFGSSLVDTVRQNPVPAALAGLGLGWLFMSARKNSSQQSRGSRGYYEGPYTVPNYSSQQYGYETTRSAQGTYGYGQQTGADYSYTGQSYNEGSPSGDSGIGGRLNSAQDAAGNALNQAQDTASQAVSQVSNTAGQVAGQAREQVSQLGDRAAYGAQRAQSGFQSMMQQNPLAVGAGAIALGLAVGLALPETDVENELMGEKRDAVVSQAQQTVSQTVQQTAQKVQSVAHEAVDAAKDEAQTQNLM